MLGKMRASMSVKSLYDGSSVFSESQVFGVELASNLFREHLKQGHPLVVRRVSGQHC